ncbi:SH3 domain-containing protein [Aliigemmobacter aestuarii]|uniref:SH3 domain-containing protein n=1 Tax=Aliigemmobacter aestuarii TaxID=1445661 RepID=UPI001B3B1CAE
MIGAGLAALWLVIGAAAAQTVAASADAPAAAPAAEGAAPSVAAPPATAASKATAKPERDPNRGAVTNLPLPRYVSLKGTEGNARRGPGLTHRIDWVFTRAGMPLRITAEFENWRRVEDIEGAGGWVHYSLLSGVRSAIVMQDLAEFRSAPDDRGQIVLQAERGVIGRILECNPDWCRLNTDGGRGWVRKTALWGTDPGEIIE